MSLPPLPGMGATTKEENYDKITTWANAVGALALNAVPHLGALPSNTNLNDIKTACVARTVAANALTALNFPVEGTAGVFVSIPGNGAGGVIHEWSPASGSNWARVKYMRASDGQGSWTAWQTYSSVTITKALGLTISIRDAVDNRLQRISSNSGWWDITTMLANGWSADKFYINRVNDELQLAVQNLKCTGANTALTTEALPSGFRPNSALGSSEVLRVSGIPLIMHSNGLIYAKSTTATTSTDLEFSTKIPVLSAWPSTAPGTAIGSIPNL